MNGLPLHPLLVHAVIALVPLTAAAVVLHALWPSARRRLGAVTPLLGLALLIAVPITVAAGRALKEQVGPIPAVERHAALGEMMPYWGAALFLASVAVWWWHRYRDRLVLAQRVRKAITIGLGIAACAVSVVALVMVYLVGDSGARAVWVG